MELGYTRRRKDSCDAIKAHGSLNFARDLSFVTADSDIFETWLESSKQRCVFSEVWREMSSLIEVNEDAIVL